MKTYLKTGTSILDKVCGGLPVGELTAVLIDKGCEGIYFPVHQTGESCHFECITCYEDKPLDEGRVLNLMEQAKNLNQALVLYVCGDLTTSCETMMLPPNVLTITKASDNKHHNITIFKGMGDNSGICFQNIKMEP